jgi:dolichol-phosphate mannosyltransferase
LDKIVIIPTYNEKENIEAIIATVLSLPVKFNVLIIDDGSPDGTGAIVKNLLATYPYRLFLEERTGKLGLGTAYIHGFKWALKNNYEYIFEMDADFSHNPSDLQNLYTACVEGADVAVGSRYVHGGAVENWPANRILLSKGASLYTRIITFMPVQDPTAGFVCYKANVLKTINLDAISFVGYAFQIEMKFAAWKLGFKIAEVPITFKDRKLGASKMNKGIIKEGIFGVIKLKWQSISKNYRRRVTTKNEINSTNIFPHQDVAVESH